MHSEEQIARLTRKLGTRKAIKLFFDDSVKEIMIFKSAEKEIGNKDPGNSFQIGFILLLKEKKRISYVNTVLDFLHDTLILSLKLSNLFFISRDFPNLQQSRQIILPAIYLSFFVQKIIARKNRNCYRKIFHAFSSFFSRCLLL